MPLNAKLVVVGGDVKTAEIKLRLPSTVGRGRGTTIMLPHPLVSRQHCELFESDGQLMVRDLGSLNGTFVNNQRVTESPLPPGELLTIGTVTFRAMYDSQPESRPPAGAAPQLKAGKPQRSETDSAGVTLPNQPASATPSSDEDLLELNEIVPIEDDAARKSQTHGTQRMETTLEDQPDGVKTTSAASAKTKPAPAKSPAAPQPGPADPNAPKVDFSKWSKGEPADEVKVDDDDLGDFLKNLKK